ncbi:transcriptional regulator, MarR family [Candidatus Koribacter versatilis Ellin345]|uniref:Transcriptional regulator, MarR family n=1 Tax=Koribacter versatilis (strain Ellin345) TaxID=204669 RepID=Q1IME8_KORVE|nr:MarR family transcriptional regulator [Candidatus Koribacter versatilis]ABF41952.1 transcriptional regulator, MarR family [Candidatus Koribacter versatilis Ellin345]
MGEEKDLLSGDYRALAEFRYQIRKFLRFSEEAARTAGLEPQQHQLLLAVKGLPEGARATIGEIADRLQIQHHSTVELVDRLEQHGYVNRKRSDRDKREVLIVLTPKSERILRELSVHHQELLLEHGTSLVTSLKKSMNAKDRGKKEKSAPAKLKSRAAAAQD